MLREFSLFALAALVVSQPVPLPSTTDSYLRIGSATAQVTLDVFGDLLCPDCAAEWSTLTALAAHYKPEQLALVLHLFPLPYHTWAFSTAYAANVIASLNNTDAAKLAWVNYMYLGSTPGQYQFYNDVLAGNSTNDVFALLALRASQVTGVSAAAVLAGLQDGNLNEATRISWKYACSKSVTGTPAFFLNDLPLFDQGDGFTLAQWEALIDPLLASAADAPCSKQLTGFLQPHTAAAACAM